MELTTLLVVVLVLGLLAGLIYLGFVKAPEEAPPPPEMTFTMPSPATPAEPPRPPRMSREERLKLRAGRERRRAARAAAAAAAAAAAEANPDGAATAETPTPGAGIDPAATEATAATPTETPPGAPAEPTFESDSNPSAEALAAAPAADTTVTSSSDDLTRIKGLGPRAATQLNALGVTRFSDLASLSPEEAGEIDGRMGSFEGRMARDRWIEQAGYLARGDLAGFEAKFGSLG